MKKPLPVQNRPVKKPALMILLLCICCLMAACGEALPPSSGGNGGSTGSPTTSPQQNVTATPTPRQLPAEPLTSIRFLDESHGWALTQHAVLRTSDGGKSWQDISPQGLTTNLSGRNALFGVFQSEQRAWVFVPPQP